MRGFKSAICAISDLFASFSEAHWESVNLQQQKEMLVDVMFSEASFLMFNNIRAYLLQKQDGQTVYDALNKMKASVGNKGCFDNDIQYANSQDVLDDVVRQLARRVYMQVKEKEPLLQTDDGLKGLMYDGAFEALLEDFFKNAETDVSPETEVLVL